MPSAQTRTTLNKTGNIRWTGKKAIGADTRGSLRDCGHADAEIDRLAQDGIIAAP